MVEPTECMIFGNIKKTPTDVVYTITRSGLRAKGSAGYPTGVKWATVVKAKGNGYGEQSYHKFVIYNADKGDPGAFMDRTSCFSKEDTFRCGYGCRITCSSTALLYSCDRTIQASLKIEGEPVTLRRIIVA